MKNVVWEFELITTSFVEVEAAFTEDVDEDATEVSGQRRFGQEKGHARLETPGPLLVGAVGCQSDDARFFILDFRGSCLEKFDDLLCTLIAVHNRHVNVHEDDLELAAPHLLSDHVQSLLSVPSQLGLQPKRLEHRLERELVEFVVIRYQHLFAVATC